MSLWFNSERRILFFPDRIMLLAGSRELTLRGVKRRASAPQLLSVDSQPSDDMPWSAALRTLGGAFKTGDGASCRYSVILSNHFVRYCLIPWSDALESEQEELAYAHHAFHEIYGDEIDSWDIRLSGGGSGNPQLACAVDERLLGALRGLFAGRRLASIQPHLMTVYNGCREMLRGKSGWFALIEQGNLCLALLRQGKWRWVRTMRIGNEALPQLPLMLDRETHLTEEDDGCDAVYLWAPFHDALPEFAEPRWRITHLEPAPVDGLDGSHLSRCAMYLFGGAG